jgi:hypothetical protein
MVEQNLMQTSTLEGGTNIAEAKFQITINFRENPSRV